jgi:hypothetical protein
MVHSRFPQAQNSAKEARLLFNQQGPESIKPMDLSKDILKKTPETSKEVNDMAKGRADQYLTKTNEAIQNVMKEYLNMQQNGGKPEELVAKLNKQHEADNVFVTVKDGQMLHWSGTPENPLTPKNVDDKIRDLLVTMHADYNNALRQYIMTGTHKGQKMALPQMKDDMAKEFNTRLPKDSPVEIYDKGPRYNNNLDLAVRDRKNEAGGGLTASPDVQKESPEKKLDGFKKSLKDAKLDLNDADIQEGVKLEKDDKGNMKLVLSPKVTNMLRVSGILPDKLKGNEYIEGVGYQSDSLKPEEMTKLLDEFTGAVSKKTNKGGEYAVDKKGEKDPTLVATEKKLKLQLKTKLNLTDLQLDAALTIEMDQKTGKARVKATDSFVKKMEDFAKKLAGAKGAPDVSIKTWNFAKSADGSFSTSFMDVKVLNTLLANQSKVLESIKTETKPTDTKLDDGRIQSA